MALLGIDVGTTSLKVSLVDPSSHTVIEEHSECLDAAIAIGVEGRDEQNTAQILHTLVTVMGKFPNQLKQTVSAIGVSGQMHGVVLWNSKLRLNELLSDAQGICNQNLSSLITWRDARCTADFLNSLPKSTKPVSTGYGCCSLFWLHKHNPSLLETFDCAGTIMDLVVYLLCQPLDTVVMMSDQNANGWGYFDINSNKWETETLQSAGFPVHLLPKVLRAPSIAGSLHQSWQGISPGIPVGVAMGDLQCSVRSVNPCMGQAVINIGTASQMIVMKQPQLELDLQPYPSLVEVPYFNGSRLIVAASLTGGMALATLVGVFKEFLQLANLSVSESEIYAILINSAKSKLNTTLHTSPVLLGERHDPHRTGCVDNISAGNISLGDIASSTLRGVVQNLESMMPRHILQTLKVSELIGCGSALYRNEVLAEHAQGVFGLSLNKKCDSDAPLGAALAVQQLL